MMDYLTPKLNCYVYIKKKLIINHKCTIFYIKIKYEKSKNVAVPHVTMSWYCPIYKYTILYLNISIQKSKGNK